MKNPWIMACCGVLLGAVATLGGSRWLASNVEQPQGFVIPEQILRASGAAAQTQFCIATGPVDGDIEGLFTLDGLTGELNGIVFYARTGLPGGHFKHNVLNDLGLGAGVAKEPRFVMVTGGAQFNRGGGGVRPANCVIYVAEANSGHIAAYTFNWNNQAAAVGQAQQGGFNLLGQFKGRSVAIE
ncbi:hypothetical protein [Lignipirellula cremea]|nr:hypothetical protein [Lignipirellula cremea]